MPSQRAQGVRNALRTCLLATLVGAAVITAPLWLSSAGGSRARAISLAGSGSAGEPVPSSITKDVARFDPSFTISGQVNGLYPGAIVPLTLTVTNRLHFAIVVTSISTAVGNASAACTSSNLTVASFSGMLKVAKQASAHTTVQLTLHHSASDGCQGAVFPLLYRGTAIRQLPATRPAR